MTLGVHFFKGPRVLCLAIDETARTIANSTGQAGTNREYLAELIKWHVENNLNDDYLTELGEYVTRTDL